MLDLVQIKTVFVISGVQSLIVVQLILKLLLQFAIGRLRSQHIRFLGRAMRSSTPPMRRGMRWNRKMWVWRPDTRARC